jgi:hypothetical protein
VVTGAVVENTLKTDGGMSASLSGEAKTPTETSRAEDRVSPAHDGGASAWRRREAVEGSD